MKMGKTETKIERQKMKEKICGGLRPTNLTNVDNRGTLIHGRLKRGNNTTVNLADND